MFAFVGNANQSVDPRAQDASKELFQPLPKEFDLALIDSLDYYLPGWEVPKNSTDFLTTHFGFVTDYLAEAFKTLRKENRYDEAERTVKFGSHVERRDAGRVHRPVSGYLKLLLPDENYESQELEQYVEMALEGRRRVKEQLKKRGSFEFFKTSFSYTDAAGSERSVPVPEQGGSGAISQDPLPPGTVYTGAVDNDGNLALYRIEITLTAGTGKLCAPPRLERELKGVSEPRLVVAAVGKGVDGLRTQPGTEGHRRRGDRSHRWSHRVRLRGGIRHRDSVCHW